MCSGAFFGPLGPGPPLLYKMNLTLKAKLCYAKITGGIRLTVNNAMLVSPPDGSIDALAQLVLCLVSSAIMRCISFITVSSSRLVMKVTRAAPGPPDRRFFKSAGDCKAFGVATAGSALAPFGMVTAGYALAAFGVVTAGPETSCEVHRQC